MRRLAWLGVGLLVGAAGAWQALAVRGAARPVAVPAAATAPAAG